MVKLCALSGEYQQPLDLSRHPISNDLNDLQFFIKTNLISIVVKISINHLEFKDFKHSAQSDWSESQIKYCSSYLNAALTTAQK